MSASRSSLSIFLYRDYTLLWVILMASSIGSWLRILGTAQWLLEDTNSAWLVGVIGFVQLVVQTPALLWGGALADRLDRKQLMVLSHALTSVSLLGLGWLLVVEQLTTAWIYFGIAITAMSHVFATLL